MPIELICKGCGQKLRVADEHAGKQARCPNCRTVMEVPAPSVSSFSAAELPRFGSTTGQQWRMRTEDGTVYGPVSEDELDRWVADGRVTPGSSLQREGEMTWLPATQLYPSLASAMPPGKNPFADNVNPHSSPTAAAASPVYAAPGRHLQPHRGGQILGMAIVGCFCCGFLAIAAWVMAANDLKEMNAGRMDPGGKGLTTAGMVVGIVGTVLMAISFLGNIVLRNQ